MPARSLTYRIEKHSLAAPFRISGYVFEHSDVVVVELAEGRHRGRGEAAGVYYLNDDPPRIVEQLESHRDAIERCELRTELGRILPMGGARNAVDCAMWELEASKVGKPAWQLAGFEQLKPLTTTFTLGAEDPGVMSEGARGWTQARAIKLKLTGEFELDIERVRAVRAARSDVWIGVDANQGFTIDQLDSLVEALVELRVSLIEQPIARGREGDLEDFTSAIPLAADESVLGCNDVEALVGRFDFVNIKLDKCGGLSEGLLMAHRAKALGLGVMVGNMVGTSLAIAPAFVVGQLCEIVDLDGPWLLRRDRTPGVRYSDGEIWCPDEVWGSGVSA